MRKLLVLPVLVGLMSAATLAHAKPDKVAVERPVLSAIFLTSQLLCPASFKGIRLTWQSARLELYLETLSPYTAPQVLSALSLRSQSYYGTAGGHKKNLWEYAKGDPRRYRPNRHLANSPVCGHQWPCLSYPYPASTSMRGGDISFERTFIRKNGFQRRV